MACPRIVVFLSKLFITNPDDPEHNGKVITDKKKYYMCINSYISSIFFSLHKGPTTTVTASTEKKNVYIEEEKIIILTKE